MGMITIMAIETGCFGACTKEDVPDMTYDFLVKKEDQKDGLELYKPRSSIIYVSEIKCPLCKVLYQKKKVKHFKIYLITEMKINYYD